MKWCMSTDVGTWTNWLNFEPDTDYSPDAGTGLLSLLSYERWCSDFTSGNSNVYVLATAAMRGFTMVLFTEPVSRQYTFVRGTYAPPSALLVFLCENCRQVISHQHGKAVFWFCEYLVTCVVNYYTMYMLITAVHSVSVLKSRDWIHTKRWVACSTMRNDFVVLPHCTQAQRGSFHLLD